MRSLLEKYDFDSHAFIEVLQSKKISPNDVKNAENNLFLQP